MGELMIQTKAACLYTSQAHGCSTDGRYHDCGKFLFSFSLGHWGHPFETRHEHKQVPLSIAAKESVSPFPLFLSVIGLYLNWILARDGCTGTMYVMGNPGK